MKDAGGLGLAFIVGMFDGIMGLAFDEISVQGVPTPFGRLVESGVLDEPVYNVLLYYLDPSDCLAWSGLTPGS